MASGPSYMLLCILMLITVKGGVASSRFLSDFGLCIVDTQLDFPTMRAGLFRRPRRPPLMLVYETDPVVERGTAATYDDQSGKIEINDDGTYLFIIHRVGESLGNRPLRLKVRNSTDMMSGRMEGFTLVEILDNGDGSIFTTNVLAELKRGDLVFINVRPRRADVMGDENNPFIFSSFLLYHDPITPFPRARRSAFSAANIAIDLAVADSIVDGFDPPTVNIGDGFDSTTGVFTAPFGGLYVLHLAATFTLITDDSGRVRSILALTVNGDTIAQVTGLFPEQERIFRYRPEVPPPNNAITVAQELNQGDTVSLKNIIATEDIEGKVFFVGYLLS